MTTGLAILVPIDSEINGIEDLMVSGRKIVVKLGTTGGPSPEENLECRNSYDAA